VAEAERHAARGEIVLSPEATGLIRTEALAPRRYALPRVSADLPSALASLAGFAPAAARVWLQGGRHEWIGVLRPMTVLFAGIDGIEYCRPDSLECVQRAHEDDPERALRCAHDLRAVAAAHGLRLSIGVATGRVFAGIVGGPTRQEYTVMGDTANLAARLMCQAGPGAALCDQATYHHVRCRLSLETLPPMRLKGKAALVPVYRRIDPGGEQAQPRPSLGECLIGRRDEWAALTNALEALRSGQGDALLLAGDAGIGKSHLVADLVDQARQLGIEPLVGAGEAIAQATPYHPWRAIFSHIFGLDELPDDPPARRGAVAAQLADEPALAGRAALLNAVLPLGFEERPQTDQMTGQVRAENTSELLLRLLERAGQNRAAPLMLVLEDAHWFDSASWALARRARRELGHALLVLTTRPPSDGAAWRGGQQLAEVRTIRLAPLRAGETIALICGRLGVEQLPKDVADVLIDKAEGNPFFSLELASALLEAGLIVVADGRCQVAPGVDLRAVALPDTVQGVITSRIDRLPPAQQLALKVASVIGRVFALHALRSIYPVASDRPHLATQLALLAENDLTTLDQVEPDVIYRFTHAIIHEVSYDLLLFTQRRLLHQAAAEWYERSFVHDLAPHYAALAYHWRRAGRPERAIGYLATWRASRRCATAPTVKRKRCSTRPATSTRRASWPMAGRWKIRQRSNSRGASACWPRRIMAWASRRKAVFTCCARSRCWTNRRRPGPAM
jgi:class 3 adenylate cyclase